MSDCSFPIVWSLTASLVLNSLHLTPRNFSASMLEMTICVAGLAAVDWS